MSRHVMSLSHIDSFRVDISLKSIGSCKTKKFVSKTAIKMFDFSLIVKLSCLHLCRQ